MASARQIAANRRNAQRSTGPRTLAGKQRSSHNAVKHGLTAEAVVTVLENPEDYQSFEAAILADYDVQSTVEHHLATRLASLLWRLRRATLIETGLFEIQAHILLQRRSQSTAATMTKDRLDLLQKLLDGRHASGASQSKNFEDGDQHQEDGISIYQPRLNSDTASVYLRLCHLHSSILKRLGRYEVALWRQVTQTLLVLDTAKTSRLSAVIRGNRQLERRL
jgi:hypothetical protein